MTIKSGGQTHEVLIEPGRHKPICNTNFYSATPKSTNQQRTHHPKKYQNLYTDAVDLVLIWNIP